MWTAKALIGGEGHHQADERGVVRRTVLFRRQHGTSPNSACRQQLPPVCVCQSGVAVLLHHRNRLFILFFNAPWLTGKVKVENVK